MMKFLYNKKRTNYKMDIDKFNQSLKKLQKIDVFDKFVEMKSFIINRIKIDDLCLSNYLPCVVSSYAIFKIYLDQLNLSINNISQTNTIKRGEMSLINIISDKDFLGHSFCVISNDDKYYIYQSYIDKYDIIINEYDYEDFNQSLNNLISCKDLEQFNILYEEMFFISENIKEIPIIKIYNIDPNINNENYIKLRTQTYELFDYLLDSNNKHLSIENSIFFSMMKHVKKYNFIYHFDLECSFCQFLIVYDFTSSKIILPDIKINIIKFFNVFYSYQDNILKEINISNIIHLLLDIKEKNRLDSHIYLKLVNENSVFKSWNYHQNIELSNNGPFVGCLGFYNE